MNEYRGAKYTNITASGLIKTGGGRVFGLVVNSHTSGTLKLWDAVTATTPVITNTYSFPAGSQTITFAEPITFYTGLYATIGGTADVTILWD